MKRILPTLAVLLPVLTPALADVLQGERLVREGRYAEAVEALAPDKDAPDACYWRGRALVQLGRYAEAHANFEKVPAGHPLFPYAARGTIYCAWKSSFINFVEAVAPLTTSDDPEISALATAAIAEFQLRHTQDGDATALQELRRMAEDNPKLAPVLRLLEVEELRTQGRYDEALRLAREIDENRDLPVPMRHRARLAMAEVYYSQGETGLGEETLLQFISANPDSPLLEEAFRRLVLHRAFLTSTYTIDRLNSWSMETDKPHRAALALLMRQRAALAGTGTDSTMSITTAAANMPTDPAARIVILEQARVCISQGKQQEALGYLNLLRDTPDARTRFYTAACMDQGKPETLQAYLECLDEAPADLQPVAAANAMYCAYLLGDEEVQQMLLHKNLPEHARRAMLVMYAALTARTNPEASLRTIELCRTLSPTPAQQADLTIIEYSIHVLDEPAGTLRQMKELEESGAMATWREEQQLHLYRLQMEAVDSAPDYSARDSRQAGIDLARHIMETAQSPAIRTEFTFNLASRLSDAGRHLEAFTLMDGLAASETEPEVKARALLLAGEEAASLGTMEYYDQAISLFTQCANIPSPYRDRAGIHRAKVLYWTNRGDEAISLLNGLLENEESLQENDRYLAYTVLADAYSMKGTAHSRDLALQTSEKLVRLIPADSEWRPRALLQYAALCSRYGMHEAALADYLSILETNPDTDTKMREAQWYSEAGKKKKLGQWYLLNYAGAGAVYAYLQLGRPGDAEALAQRVADWERQCPSRIADELGLEYNQKTFADWAVQIRRNNAH